MSVQRRVGLGGKRKAEYEPLSSSSDDDDSDDDDEDGSDDGDCEFLRMMNAAVKVACEQEPTAEEERTPDEEDADTNPYKLATLPKYQEGGGNDVDVNPRKRVARALRPEVVDAGPITATGAGTDAGAGACDDSETEEEHEEEETEDEDDEEETEDENDVVVLDDDTESESEGAAEPVCNTATNPVCNTAANPVRNSAADSVRNNADEDAIEISDDDEDCAAIGLLAAETDCRGAATSVNSLVVVYDPPKHAGTNDPRWICAEHVSNPHRGMCSSAVAKHALPKGAVWTKIDQQFATPSRAVVAPFVPAGAEVAGGLRIGDVVQVGGSGTNDRTGPSAGAAFYHVRSCSSFCALHVHSSYLRSACITVVQRAPKPGGYVGTVTGTTADGLVQVTTFDAGLDTSTVYVDALERRTVNVSPEHAVLRARHMHSGTRRADSIDGAKGTGCADGGKGAGSPDGADGDQGTGCAVSTENADGGDGAGEGRVRASVQRYLDRCVLLPAAASGASAA
jgi:hypothetical protein